MIPRLIQGEQLAHLRALTDQIVAEARGVAANDDLYDLEPSHSATLPREEPQVSGRRAFVKNRVKKYFEHERIRSNV